MALKLQLRLRARKGERGVLLYRCDNDLCHREAEPSVHSAGRLELPLSDNWRHSPYGDFCCEQCEQEVTTAEQEKEAVRRWGLTHV